MTSAGRLYGRPVFFDLPKHWRDPFVTTAVTGVTEDLADQSAADGVVFSDKLAEAQSSLTVTHDGFAIDWLGDGGPRAGLRAWLGGQPGLNSFDDEVALEFGDVAETMTMTARPKAPPVSRFSRKLMNSMPSRLSLVEHFKSADGSRPAGPEAHTSTTSNSAPQAAGHSWHPGAGRRALVPLMMSLYSCATVKPRCSAMRRRSWSWVTAFWSEVETRV